MTRNSKFGSGIAVLGALLILMPVLVAPAHTCISHRSPASCRGCLWTVLSPSILALVLAAEILGISREGIFARPMRVISVPVTPAGGRAPPSF